MAELLGNPLARKETLDASCDLNTIGTGIYDFFIEKGLPANMPEGAQRGAIIVFRNPYHPLQIVAENGKFCFRLGGERWSNWNQL